MLQQLYNFRQTSYPTCLPLNIYAEWERKKGNLKPGRNEMFWLGLAIKKRYQNCLKKQKHLQDRQNGET